MTGSQHTAALAAAAHRFDARRLAAVLEQDMAAVLELSPDARILHANDHFCRLIGFPREQLLGKHLSELTPSEDWPVHRAVLDQILDGGVPKAIETRLLCLNGGYAWVSAVTRLIREDDGQPADFIALLLDISPLVLMRDRLIVAEGRLRLALDGARMGVWSWDPLSGRLECSHVALAFLGLPPGAKLSFADFIALVSPEERADVETAFRIAADSLEPLDIDFSVTWPDGTRRWLSLMARESRDEVGIQGLVGDVTNRKVEEAHLIEAVRLNRERSWHIEMLNARLAKRAVDAETAIRTREALLRNVGHEFRTPLNHICGALDILLLDDVEASQRRWLVTARDAALALTRTVSEVMEMARLAGGEVSSERLLFSPFKVLDEVAQLLAPRVKARELAISIEVADDVPEQVFGDGTHVAQSLLSYLDNAIKFTPSGRVTLAVRRGDSQESGLRLRFEVRDTGIGISAAQIERLFQPFVQGDDSTTRPYGGLGVGLSNVRELAALMGGLVGVESRIGEGSTFWLEVPVQSAALDTLPALPAKLAAKPYARPPAAPGAADLLLVKAHLRGLRGLLLVDDMLACISLEAAPPALPVLAGSIVFERLQRQVKRFDFSAALQTLDLIEGHVLAGAEPV
jgi:PAS domain S-box-containing protein